MAKIAILIDDLFEDVEYTHPAQAFRNAGHDVVHVGMKQGLEVNGKTEGTPVIIDRDIRDVSVEDFDALFIPGGYSPDRLRAHPEPVAFVRDFAFSDKPMFMICHGPQLLITADVLQGRKVTGWKSITQDLKNAGAQYLDRNVVEDNNFVFSRGPQDLPEFINACLERLKKEAPV